MSHTDEIRRAHDAVAARAQLAARCPWRPHYHFAAPAGWINDPNGLIYFRGRYHLFYQHHPYSARWGPMHWGHAVSDDLLHWEHLPIALAPSEVYETPGDACGCFSGSAIEHDGRLVLMYTGHSPSHSPQETQNIASSQDGITFVKSLGNPVIPVFPPEGSAEFRDPRIWQHDGMFYAVVGTTNHAIGKVLLYRSADLTHWEYLGVAVQSDGTQGEMWECPDLFELDGQHVLIFSPTGLGRPLSMYLVGSFSYTTYKFAPTSGGLIDHGSDFYAPQTLLDSKGRRIMIAWMQAWGAKVPTERNGWSGAMTLPRVLQVVNGRLLQSPAPEMEPARQNAHPISETVPANTVARLGISGESLELSVKITAAAGCSAAGVRVRCSADKGEFTEIRWSARGELTLDRTHSGEGNHDERTAPCTTPELRIFVDRSSVEVFSADGSLAITSRIYPADGSTGIELFTIGGEARFEGAAWPLLP